MTSSRNGMGELYQRLLCRYSIRGRTVQTAPSSQHIFKRITDIAMGVISDICVEWDKGQIFHQNRLDRENMCSRGLQVILNPQRLALGPQPVTAIRKLSACPKPLTKIARVQAQIPAQNRHVV